MTGDDLTREQVDKLGESLRPAANYLARLVQRMDQEFPPDDPLLKHARDAYNAMLTLTQDLHYRSCDGVGRTSRP